VAGAYPALIRIGPLFEAFERFCSLLVPNSQNFYPAKVSEKNKLKFISNIPFTLLAVPTQEKHNTTQTRGDTLNGIRAHVTHI
jgi:hypothetical protein